MPTPDSLDDDLEDDDSDPYKNPTRDPNRPIRKLAAAVYGFDIPRRLPIDCQKFSIIQTLLPLVLPAMAISRPFGAETP